MKHWLSDRQLEVLRLYAQGKGAADVAAELGMAHGTVLSHCARIRKKLGVQRMAAAAAVAAERGECV